MGIAIQIDQKDGWDVVRYIGPINEEAEVHLSQVLPKLGPKCVMNFRQVEYVNSCGVRGWINFMRNLEKNRQVVFEECTPEIVMQINMIPSFKGNAQIHSVYSFYSCSSCSHQQSVLFVDGKNLPKTPDDEIPPVACPKCGNQMEMEELEEEFFAFRAAA